MAKKITRRGLIKKIDTLVSKIVRSKKKKCEKCGSNKSLQCCHIFSRTKMSVRFDLDNCLVLCYRCHFFWAHRNPVDFVIWVQKYLGDEKFAELILKAQKIKKWTTQELEELYKTLKTKEEKK